MLLTSRNVIVFSAISLLVLLFYTVELPLETLRIGVATLNSSVLPLLRQILSENLPYRAWSPAAPASTVATGPHKHQKIEGESHEDTRTKFTRHIVAVGDLHGDLPNARRVLQFSGVTDDLGKWSGNVDFFVQTGDIIDR